MISTWITKGRQTVDLLSIPANSYIMRAHCHVTQAFNSDGTDTIVVGTDADPDAVITSIDVSSTGIKSITLGVNAGFNGASQQFKIVYSNSGSEPTTGAALFLFEIAKVPNSPI